MLEQDYWAIASELGHFQPYSMKGQEVAVVSFYDIFGKHEAVALRYAFN